MIDILMATYNGEKYLREQINSIINQTYSDWKLYIRDDGSEDKTINIISEYVAMYPEKIRLIQDGKKGLGAKLNFGELLKVSDSDYCMFCDQDDVWLERKIENTLYEMKRLETQHGNNTPILVHTDLLVVDENLNILDNSFFRFQNIDPTKNKLKHLLISNTVTGCTMMLNKSLVKQIKSIPKETSMHDWWIALVASCIGKIYTIQEPSIMYRQHSNNTIGAQKYKKSISVRRFIKNQKKYIEFTRTIIERAKILKNIFYSNNINKNCEILDKYIELKNKSYLYRKISLIKDGLLNGSIKTKIILFIYM